MKPFAIALLIAGAVWAQDQDKQKSDPGPKAGVTITVGWDGDFPVGWDGWSDAARAEHTARMEAAKAELAAYIEAAHTDRLETNWDVEVSFGLYKRSVNAGFSAPASMDLVKTFVVENARRDDAEAALKTAATESAEAEKDDADAKTKEKEFQNLGQWVKAQVHGGLHGTELAAAIHKRIKARHEAKMAGKDPDEVGDEHGQGDDRGRGNGDDNGHGRGNGDDHGQGGGHGGGEGHGHGHGPK